MSFLTWLSLQVATLANSLCAKSPGRHKIKFLYYRLADWLRNQFHHSPLASKPP